MLRKLSIGIGLAVIGACCVAQAHVPDWTGNRSPDWKRYRAEAVSSPDWEKLSANRSQVKVSPAGGGRFTFGDLKGESDESLAHRLLGEAGRRIGYIDRRTDRWRYYKGDDDGAERVDLYTHPYALGSQFGLCGAEKYSIEFDGDGRIDSVSVSKLYGVEGPIFQKKNSDSDWDHYYKVMCASVPAAHAPSYFPATDAIMADHAAELLLTLFDLASSPAVLPFSLQCRSGRERTGCSQDIRDYLGQLRLDDVDELSQVNCVPADAPPNSVCFTIRTGVHQLGRFPKDITVKGSTYMHNVRIDSVEVLESVTLE